MKIFGLSVNPTKFIYCLIATIGVHLSFCHAARPTYPLPLYNSLGKGICFFNAVLQCLLQYPKFCEFVDKVDKPNGILEAQLKILRTNLKQFACDKQLLNAYLNNPFIAWNDTRVAEIRRQIISCSKDPCLKMYKYPANLFSNFGSNVLVSTYKLLKLLFCSELKALFYSRNESTVFDVLDIISTPVPGRTDFEYELADSGVRVQPIEGLDYSFFFLYIPKLDFIAAIPIDLNEGAIATRLWLEDYHKMISAIEVFLTKNIVNKKCELKAIDFMVSKGIIPVKYSEDCKILSVKEVPAPCFAHSAAYVKHNSKWILCDDFFREKLYDPMIREFTGGLPDVLEDLVNREKGELGMLFFRVS